MHLFVTEEIDRSDFFYYALPSPPPQKVRQTLLFEVPRQYVHVESRLDLIKTKLYKPNKVKINCSTEQFKCFKEMLVIQV